MHAAFVCIFVGGLGPREMGQGKKKMLLLLFHEDSARLKIENDIKLQLINLTRSLVASKCNLVSSELSWAPAAVYI